MNKSVNNRNLNFIMLLHGRANQVMKKWWALHFVSILTYYDENLTSRSNIKNENEFFTRIYKATVKKRFNIYSKKAGNRALTSFIILILNGSDLLYLLCRLRKEYWVYVSYVCYTLNEFTTSHSVLSYFSIN